MMRKIVLIVCVAYSLLNAEVVKKEFFTSFCEKRIVKEVSIDTHAIESNGGYIIEEGWKWDALSKQVKKCEDYEKCSPCSDLIKKRQRYITAFAKNKNIYCDGVVVSKKK